MDLLNILSGLMTQSSSIDALSAKSGTDSNQTKGILSAALPMLLGALTKNASSESGAASLLGALKQHTNTASMKEQIEKADAEDGGKIIQHILGSNQKDVIQSISEKTGANTEQIRKLLSNMAPGMMSGISAATSAASGRLGKGKAQAGEKLGQGKAVASSALAAQQKAAAAVLEKQAKVAAQAKAVQAKVAKEKAEQAKAAIEKAEQAKAAAQAEQEKGGLDLSGLLGVLGAGGAKDEGSGGIGSLLGGLFGGNSGNDGKEGDNSLLGALSSLFK